MTSGGPRTEHLELPSGVRSHLVRRGPTGGPVPWLLVHGLASNARLWDGVAERLAAAGHPVAAVDQRGHGRSSKPDGPYDMATVADDLALVLDGLGWERAAVAGQSWGGNVVVELARRHADRLVVTVAVDGGVIDLRSRFEDWTECVAALAPPRLAGTSVGEIERWMREANPDWPESGIQGSLANFEVRPDGTVAPWLTFERHLAVLRGLWDHRPHLAFPQLTVPLLLIAADTGDDEATASKQAAVDEAVAALDRGRAAWFRPAHHDVHAQRPDEVSDLLLSALDIDTFFATDAVIER